MTDAPVHVVPYDPSWPALFEAERAVLARVLAPWLAGPIEHIGSTAVIGLCAKPVIDILCGVTSLVESEPAKEAVCEIGYLYAPYKVETEHWFCRPSPAFRTHHLHLMPYESRTRRDAIAFRDLLRRDASVAAEYAALKVELARRFEFDREAYTQAKYPFIARALATVRGAAG